MRKVNPVFPHRQKRLREAASGSYAIVGADTSMSAIAVTAIGFDATTGKMTDCQYADMRWTTDDDDYLQRLADAAGGHNLVLDVLRKLWVIEPERTFIAIEEPFPMGLANSGRVKFKSAWIKQQSEVSGAFLGSLYRYGFHNIFQINVQQWRKVLTDSGVTIRKMPEGKWDIKAAMIERYGLPDLPDLVNSKKGSKIPRPESGYGAKAKAVQPMDTYDAAAVMFWMETEARRMELI